MSGVDPDREPATIQNLTPGTKYYFAVEDGEPGFAQPFYAPVITAYGSGSATTTGMNPAVPTAPQSVSGTYVTGTGGAPGYVQLHWTNSSNNETSFQIQRSSNGSGGPWTNPVTVSADPSMSFEDKTMTDLGPWTYEVRAVNSAGNSAWTFTTTPIAPVGGPDITVHLLKIRRALRNWYNNTLTPAQQQAFKDEWVTSVSGLLWDLRFDPVKVTNNAGNWDIQELMKQSAQTTHNDGVLPNGIHTVTVAGHVYPDDEVNYWLYGCLGDLLGWSQQGILGLIQFYRNQRWKGTGIVGRWAWTLAGWADDQTLPSTISTTGTAFATYGPVAGALPAASPPASEEIGPMIYEAGFGMLGIGRIFDKQ